MKLTPRQRRAEHKGRNQTMVDMNLVSLIDVFTILIFFLLSSAAGVETLVSPKAVNLPAALDGGLSLARGTFQNLNGLLSLEARATRGRKALLAVGGELDSPAGAALRFGVRSGDDIATWSAGAGWHTKALRVDYAFVPSRLELDDTHRFSLTASF